MISVQAFRCRHEALSRRRALLGRSSAALLCLSLLLTTSCDLKGRVDQCNDLAGVLNEAPQFKIDPKTPSEQAADQLGKASMRYRALANSAQELKLDDEEVASLRKELVKVFEQISKQLEKAQAALLREDMIAYARANKAIDKLTRKAKKLGHRWQETCNRD